MEKNSPFTPLNEALDKLNQTVKKRTKEAKSVMPPEEVEVSQLSLELWPNKVRGVPNAALRGALFSVAQVRTIAKKRELISSVGGIEVRFKGERFNQTDLDVLEMLLHYARRQPLESKVEFSANQLLQDLDRGTGGEDHDQLNEEIARLMGGVVEITWKKEKKSFAGQFVQNKYRDEESGRVVVIFDKKLLTLYEDGYTYVDWEQRKALGKKSLAKWLHGFYSSHGEPFAYKVETLMQLCGSTTKRLGDFRKALVVALEEVRKVGGIKAWKVELETDLVYIIKQTSQKKLAKSEPPAGT